MIALSTSLKQPDAQRLAGEEFNAIRRMVREASGINLTEAKKELVVSRLSRRLRMLGLDSFAAYVRFVEGNPQEAQAMLNCITTNVTNFFRERHHFDFLKEVYLPRIERAARAGAVPKKIRIWSAGCATGEEPYSLAMLVHSYFQGNHGWSVHILASDVNTEALEKGKKGIYTDKEVQGVPYELLKKYFFLGTGPHRGLFKAKDALRSMLSFCWINLAAEGGYPLAEPLHLIFCRNVFIYFDRDTRSRALANFHRCLAPGGLLFLGHSESIHSLSGQHSRWRLLRHTIYEKLT